MQKKDCLFSLTPLYCPGIDDKKKDTRFMSYGSERDCHSTGGLTS